MEIVNESSEKEKGSSLSNTVNVPQTRSEPYIRRYNLKNKNYQEFKDIHHTKNITQKMQIANNTLEKNIMENNSFTSINENQVMEQTTPSIIATELVLEKLKAANINVITDQNEMQAVLDAGIEVQKMAAHYGTNQNIENAESFNGYGVYVLSVNEENARNFGLKIAAKKYGNSFYINNQPLQEFLQERNFSPYWQSVISQVQNPSNETLLHSVMTSDVKGNPVLLKEQNQLSTLCGLNLINYKREQTYLYSVEIPDNDGTNYLYYDKSIGLESAERINTELSKLGTNWQVSRNDTGYSVYFNILSNKVFNSQKQASEFLQKIGYVGMETSTENYIIFDDREMNINNRVQYMITENGELYGFAYNGQIYADKNLMNSNVLAHEYTHLWDNYTRNQNHELWERGKNVFKQTSIWNEVLNDPNYQNIRNNEDEILSECHARICGKFAQSVLERIARENGENAKNAVIDWDKEVNNFVAKEFGFSPELGSENYISESINAESMKDFLTAPMKDLMNGVGFEKRIEKEATTFEEAQKQYPNIVDLSEAFNTPAPTEKEVLETLRSMVGKVYATATEDKFLTIYNSREKNDHVIKGDNYKKDFRKTRETNRKLVNNAEKLIQNAIFTEAELADPKKNKEKLLGMHNYEVPVFVNGHGFMVRLEGEVIKNAPDYSPGNKALKNTLTSEAQLDSNEILLELQAAKVSNLYVVRKQRPLFKIENEQSKDQEYALYLPKHSWSGNLKEVITNTSYQEMINNRELQIAGKSGNEEAAVELVDKLVDDKIISQLAELYPNAIVVPIPSMETADKKPNAIPLAYARKFEKAGLQITDDIIEIDSAHHTGKKSFKRVVNRPHFDGTIEQGREYIIVDDVFAMGGTINSMRNFIEDKGGNVVAVSTLTPSVENSKILAITDENLNSLKSLDKKGDLLNAIRKLDIAENFEALTDPIGKYIVNNREKIINEERTRRTKINSKTNDEKNQRIDQINSELTDYTDPIEVLEESYNTPENPTAEEDIEAEKILHDKYIQDELNKTVEKLYDNGNVSEFATESKIAAQKTSENYEEEPVIVFNDTNGNPHFPQEIVLILENFQKVEPAKWNVPAEDKTAVFHLMQLTEIDKNDFENSLAKLQEYMITEEFKREEKNYAEIFTPILLTSLNQDFDEATHTFSSEKFSYKFSTDELKEEIPVKKGEIKSILDNDFTGGNVKLTQDFQNELIEKGLVKPEEKFLLINEVEAVAHGTKIKEGEPFVILTIPVENNGKKEFVQTKYYHVSALEEPQKILSENKNEELTVEEKKIIFGETKIPEFAMITQHGLENFKDMIIDSYEESSKSFLLKSEDGKNNVRVTENTLKTLTSDEYAKKSQSYTQNTKTAEKLLETQYKDFFELRSNCANNFRHNLSVFCRKEANSPLDALKVASSLISQMSKEEKRKTKELLNLLRKDGQTVNEVLVETYHEAVKETPLNEDYIKHNRYEKMIARPMYDTLSTKGEKIDRDFNLKIGDSVDITFKVDKNPGSRFSLRKDSIYQNCTIISASKEGNVVTLMDGNKSFYDVPRDTFLKEYAQKQKNEQKFENKVHRQHAMQIEIER